MYQEQNFSQREYFQFITCKTTYIYLK